MFAVWFLQIVLKWKTFFTCRERGELPFPLSLSWIIICHRGFKRLCTQCLWNRLLSWTKGISLKASCGQEMCLKGWQVLGSVGCSKRLFLVRSGLFLWAVLKNSVQRMDIGKINQIDSTLMTQIKSWTLVLYGNKASSSSLIAFLHSRFPQPAYSFKVTSPLSRCACLTEHLKTRAWSRWTFCKRNSIQLQSKKSQNLVNLTNVKCQHPVKLQSGGGFFSLRTAVVNCD